MVFPLIESIFLLGQIATAGLTLHGQKKQTDYARKERFAGLTSERDALLAEVGTAKDTLSSKLRQNAALSNLYVTGTESITQWGDTQRARIEQDYGLKTMQIGKKYVKRGKEIFRQAQGKYKPTPAKTFESLG